MSKVASPVKPPPKEGGEPTKRKIATKGWHWGEYQWEGKKLHFSVDNKQTFDIFAPDISQVTAPTKTDVALEFHQDESRDPMEDQLLEVRFYVPPNPLAGEDDEQPSAILKNEFVSRAGVGGGAEATAMLVDVPMLVPRGRYEVDLFKSSMKLHGKSFDYNIPYKSIARMFLLPRSDGVHQAFVVALDTPMRQGQTRYPFVVMQFTNQKDLEVDVALTEEELTQFPDLKKRMEGKMYDVIVRLFKALVAKPVIVPDSGEKGFKSAGAGTSFRCSHKASDGHLYPLNKSFIFIVKPVIFIRYADILNVEFSRTLGSQTRYFEFKVQCRGGAEFDFTSIDKNEYQPLVVFLQSKSIKLKNLEETAKAAKKAEQEAENDIFGGDLPSDEEDDEDFEGGEEEEEDDDDADDDGDDEEEGEGDD